MTTKTTKGTSASTPSTHAKPFVRWLRGGPVWYAKWSRHGTQVMRALGPAWVDRAPGGRGWRKRPGRPEGDALTESGAIARMLELVAEHERRESERERDEAEGRRRGATFREVAEAYLWWLEEIFGAKPNTLREHRFLLVEPGTPHKRGEGAFEGLIMKTLGDRPVVDITTREINALLEAEARRGVSPRTVNKVRQLVSAILGYAVRAEEFTLEINPAAAAHRRREPPQKVLDFYSPEDVEALARSLADGRHRGPLPRGVGPAEIAARAAEDAQDAEIVRVAAYAGLRRGELLALRWRDVDFVGRKIIVRRAVSGDVDVESTKSGKVREVPLPDQAAGALNRVSRRGDYTGPDDYVFANRYGRRLDGSALRRRFERARDAAGLGPLRFHDLRHTYGSLLVAAGIDLASVKAAMGHSRITTTERYLHARPAHEQADRFTRALGGTPPRPRRSLQRPSSSCSQT